MTDEELDAATEGLQFMLDQYRDKQSWEGHPRKLRDGITAITTLRAQLAEARGDATVLCDALRRAEIAAAGAREERDSLITRADRAEAALAAQIEADAKTCETSAYTSDGDGYHFAHLIRSQPRDRTALDRMLAEAREKALREAEKVVEDMAAGALTARAQEHAIQCQEAILALIEKGKTE